LVYVKVLNILIIVFKGINYNNYTQKVSLQLQNFISKAATN